MAMVIIRDNQVPHGHGLTVSGLIFLFVLEICIWFGFIRVWREVKRRMPEK
jgi:hypothetical protein